MHGKRCLTSRSGYVFSDITCESPVPLINRLSDGQQFQWSTSESSDSGETTEDYESHGAKRRKVGTIWASAREKMSSGFVNTKANTQPAHSRSLISTFVIRFLESFVCKLATGEISIFLASLCS